MSNAPQFEDEFERKLIEALTQVRAKYERGQIASHAYQHTLEALNDTSRGLCDETLSLAIDQERDFAGYGDDIETTVWKTGSNVVVVTKGRMGETCRVITEKNGKTQDKLVSFADADIPSEACTEWSNKVKASMIKRGFERVV